MKISAALVSIAVVVSLLIALRSEETEDRAVVLVVYFTKTGHTKLMAESVAAGARSNAGVDVRLRAVHEATSEDVARADAIIVGSPVYNANVAPDVLKFIGGWPFRDGALRDKIGAAFVTAGGMSAGEEAAQMSLLRAMLVFSMIVVGGPDWRQAFGASAVVDEDPTYDPAKERPEAREPVAAYYLRKGEALGKRVADVAVRWKRAAGTRATER